MEENGCTFNKNGIPCCPHDPSLPMKREGSKSHLRSKLPTMKFVCPKMKWEYNPVDKSKRRVCHCNNPCTTSSCGRMIYVYPEKNLRAYPGAERGSKEWEETYFSLRILHFQSGLRTCFAIAYGDYSICYLHEKYNILHEELTVNSFPGR